jgi:hypothetical protein
MQGFRDFWQLLSLVQSACAADMPGLVLGYADGSHGAVSPDVMCLEREGGQSPTVASVRAWTERKAGANSDGSPVFGNRPPRPGKGKLPDEAAFRRAMAGALSKLHRLNHSTKAKTAGQESAPAKGSVNLETTVAKASGAGRGLGPLRRFVEAIEAQWDDLVSSPNLPPACSLTAQWLYSLAKHRQSSGEDYAPKTLRNYWYSWALRVIENFGPTDPVQLSGAEIEELYLQIVEDADLENRQHLYPPMRNLHRYLVINHGVSEIEWSELRAYFSDRGRPFQSDRGR